MAGHCQVSELLWGSNSSGRCKDASAGDAVWYGDNGRTSRIWFEWSTANVACCLKPRPNPRGDEAADMRSQGGEILQYRRHHGEIAHVMQ